MAETKTGRKTGKITKREAVYRALQALGWDAPTAEVHAHIKEHCGYDMTPNHISTSKGELRKIKGIKTKGRKKKSAAAAAAPAPAAREKGEIELEDILAVKALAQRVGVSQLRVLIDTFAR